MGVFILFGPGIAGIKSEFEFVKTKVSSIGGRPENCTEFRQHSVVKSSTLINKLLSLFLDFVRKRNLQYPLTLLLIGYIKCLEN